MLAFAHSLLPRREIATSIRHPALAALYAYWQRLGGGDGVMPKRRAFDPVDLDPSVWPRLFLIATSDRRESCEVRVQGTYMVEAYGRDFTGMHCNDAEIPHFGRSNTARLLENLIREHAPQYDFGSTNFRFYDDYRICEQVLLPLADETGALCAAIGAVDFPAFRGVRP